VNYLARPPNAVLTTVMSTAIVIVFALAIVAVTIDVLRRIPKRRRKDPDSQDQFITTQKIIVDLNRR
jgi:ABC-type uncharacterized transport system YnjBCD permease subunit